MQLDSSRKTLEGTQTLTWENPGTKPVDQLYFHLYPNAFMSKNTTFMLESGGKLRNDKMKEGSFGSMTVSKILTLDGKDLTPSLQYVRPDDGNQNDYTLARIRLPQAVMPHEKVTLRMNFTDKLPVVFARMGYLNDFIMAGQWFPKIAVYEPKGTRGLTEDAWNLHQYHGDSEFYADFGTFDVNIKVPTDYIVAATGFPYKPPSASNGFKTYHYYAEDVHDFAWAASPHFQYVEEPFSAPNIPGVKIKLYLQPGQSMLKDRYMLAAKKALRDYSDWFGPYPYSTLSIVIPPAVGNGAGGMEYPTLVTGWSADQTTEGHGLERVIVHEIGHQFWYAMVASNEFEEAWLDEGFTSFAEDMVMQQEYDIRPNIPIQASYITSPEALNRYAWQYGSHGKYAENVYMRAKLVLLGIEKQIGGQDMIRVLKAYFTQWKFKHPNTLDFEQTLERVTKKSWKPYFDQFVYNASMEDFAVSSIHVQRVNQKGTTEYKSEVVIVKNGGSYGNVPIYFHFADGTNKQSVWNPTNNRVKYEFVYSSPIDWTVIDPDYSQVLENKHINNFMRTSIDVPTELRWNIGASKVIEMITRWLAW
ncbi:MAG: EnpEP protein [Paenibacillus sp. RIFOXYA1_FULL_44_5]|nr:MAG: EnpEP protein [Paenibacillus sp. RIFOXYA1_FULL_44_5]